MGIFKKGFSGFDRRTADGKALGEAADVTRVAGKGALLVGKGAYLAGKFVTGKVKAAGEKRKEEREEKKAEIKNQYLKIILTLFFILYAKVIYAFIDQFLIPDIGIYYQIINYINFPYALVWTVIEDHAPFLMHDVVQQWQVNFLIPGGIIMDVGLLILAYSLSLDARNTVKKPKLIFTSLPIIIAGLILNYILGWIAHIINSVIS